MTATPDASPRSPAMAVAALALGYAVFAVLLNSVGPVILQSIIHFHVDKLTASTLEAFKDLTIAGVSFTLAAQVPRLGFRRAMVLALALAGAGCLLVPLTDRFWAVRALFVCVGCGFALMKVAVYALVGAMTRDAAGHARLLGFIEASFMLAVVASAWIFAWFIDPRDPGSAAWLAVYWWLAGACALASLLVMVAPLPGAAPDSRRASLGAMLALLRQARVAWFVPAVFLYVFIEQGLGTWLPALDHLVLRLDEPMAVRAASALALAIAAGRFVAGLVVTRIGWFALLLGCLAAMAGLLVAVPLLGAPPPGVMIHSWAALPPAAWALPLVGFFMAPVYPTLNSVVLSSVDRADQPGLIGLIVVFSALGGTTGSRVVALLFGAVPGAGVLLCLIPPIAALSGVIVVLRRMRID